MNRAWQGCRIEKQKAGDKRKEKKIRKYDKSLLP